MFSLASIKTACKSLPILKELAELRSALAAARESGGLFVPPGHFYSPIPSQNEIKKDEARVFGSAPRTISSLALNESEQLALLRKLVRYYGEMPAFPTVKQDGLRYYFANPEYKYSDAILLHCMIRHLQPRRIIEVGCGHSSCMILDTNELFFENSIATTFVDPHPRRLLSLIREADKGRINVVRSRLQDVERCVFEALGANDMLLIDSTHVSKTDSDVNHVVFDVLPLLSSGVHVHFHDIFYPFEYPMKWVYEGRAWNEAYLIRAFLQYNDAFRVVLMNTFMEFFHESFFRENMPLCLKSRGGSLWIRKE